MMKGYDDYMTFCNVCLEILFDGIIPKIEGVCPKVDCNGVLVEVDEVIAPAILLLYSKGYKCVEDSCSGHAHIPSSTLYIRFSEYSLIEDCPHGFELLYEGTSILIKKTIESTDILQRQVAIFEAILHLREWAVNLDDYQWPLKRYPSVNIP